MIMSTATKRVCSREVHEQEGFQGGRSGWKKTKSAQTVPCYSEPESEVYLELATCVGVDISDASKLTNPIKEHLL